MPELGHNGIESIGLRATHFPVWPNPTQLINTCMYFILPPGKLLSECSRSELSNLTELLICVLLDSLYMPVHIALFYRTVPVGLCCGLVNCKYCEYRCMEVSSWKSSILNQYSPGLNHSNLYIHYVYSATVKQWKWMLVTVFIAGYICIYTYAVCIWLTFAGQYTTDVCMPGVSTWKLGISTAKT